MKSKFLLLALLAFLCALSAVAMDARVTSVTGKVQVQRKGTSEWVDVRKNDLIKEGDIISTGFNSNATINLGDSVCTVSPLTRMSIEQLTRTEKADTSATKTTVYIDSGKAAFKVNSSGKNLNDFKVHSPASTSSVRGTEFIVYSDGEVVAKEGLVGVSDGIPRAYVKRERFDEAAARKQTVNAFTKTDYKGTPSTPVFAGQRTGAIVSIESVSNVALQPIFQRKEDVTYILGEAGSIADRRILNGSNVPTGSVNAPQPEKEISNTFLDINLGETVDITVSVDISGS